MKTRSLVLVLLCLGFFAQLGSAAHARNGGNRGRAHDAGNFFMRLSAGLGYDRVSFDAEETRLSGLGGAASFAFGATVARNLAVAVDLFGLSMFEPSVSQNGRDLGDAEDTTLSLGAIGIGATYYFMPLNLYVAGSLGAGVGTLQISVREGPFVFHIEEDSKVGFALNFMVGKEWWVARRWGIGVAAQLIYSALETDDDVDFGVLGVSLLFSVTMN